MWRQFFALALLLLRTRPTTGMRAETESTDNGCPLCGPAAPDRYADYLTAAHRRANAPWLRVTGIVQTAFEGMINLRQSYTGSRMRVRFITGRTTTYANSRRGAPVWSLDPENIVRTSIASRGRSESFATHLEGYIGLTLQQTYEPDVF